MRGQDPPTALPSPRSAPPPTVRTTSRAVPRQAIISRASAKENTLSQLATDNSSSPRPRNGGEGSGVRGQDPPTALPSPRSAPRQQSPPPYPGALCASVVKKPATETAQPPDRCLSTTPACPPVCKTGSGPVRPSFPSPESSASVQFSAAALPMLSAGVRCRR